MTDIKSKVQSIEPNVKARDLSDLVNKTGNIYESLVAIGMRSEQLTVAIKRELREKLDEFAIHTDAIEEIQENKEQIEISKFYERLPNPAIIALNEFLEDELNIRNRNQDETEEEDLD
jgi:DNA-directed RNA polymerase subunit K/omega